MINRRADMNYKTKQEPDRTHRNQPVFCTRLASPTAKNKTVVVFTVL